MTGVTTNRERSVPPSSDPLGEVLHLLRLDGTVYCRSELTAPFGIELPPMEGHLMFHVVLSGRVVLEVDGEASRVLERGSVALLPKGEGHRLRSEEPSECLPLFDLPIEQVSERYEVLRCGGGGETTHLVCCVMRFDHVAAEHLVAVLPDVLAVDTWDRDDDSWLSSSLRFLAREAQSLKPGGETVITRLADILVIEMIRSWIDSVPLGQTGWLAALRDEQIGRSLSVIQKSPQSPWTVASLAETVHMSRSAFSARFTALVGMSPMRYLAQWRMRVARRQIRTSQDSIARVSHSLGYESEASFCRAFKREFGVSPGSVRQSSPT